MSILFTDEQIAKVERLVGRAEFCEHHFDPYDYSPAALWAVVDYVCDILDIAHGAHGSDLGGEG